MRERHLIILWLDNLGAFYPLIGELGLTNIAAAFEGDTVVCNLVGAVPSVTESAEVVVKEGCGLDMLPVLGERQDAILLHNPHPHLTDNSVHGIIPTTQSEAESPCGSGGTKV